MGLNKSKEIQELKDEYRKLTTNYIKKDMELCKLAVYVKKQKQLYSKKLIAKTKLIKQLKLDLALERATKQTTNNKKIKI